MRFVHSTWKVSSTRCTDLWSIFSLQSLYRISCPLVAKRTNTLLTTFVVNVRRLFPSFSQPQHIILNVVQLSHTLHQLFIYKVASNAAISSELPHARSLTCGWIPELFKRRHPSANTSKIFLARPYNYEILFTRNFSYEIFSTWIFSNLRCIVTLTCSFCSDAHAIKAHTVEYYPIIIVVIVTVGNTCVIACDAHKSQLEAFKSWDARLDSTMHCGNNTL